MCARVTALKCWGQYNQMSGHSNSNSQLYEENQAAGSEGLREARAGRAVYATEVRELQVQRQSWRKVNAEHCPPRLSVPAQVGVAGH